MSYAALTNNLRESLRSSTGLAALGSVGFHILLLAALPVLPLDSKAVESQGQRTVGLIELSPAEQSRLPQAVSTSPDTLPPPIATQSSVLPPLPPPPAINLPPAGVPPAYNYPPVATQPSILPPLPPPPAINLPPAGVPPAYKYPLRASLPPPPTLRVPSTAPYQDNRPFTSLFSPGKLSAPAPSQPRSEQLPPPPTLPGSSNLPSTNGLKPAAPFSQPATSPTPTAQQNTTLENTNQPQNQRFAIANPQTTQSATSARPERIPDRGRENLLALRERLRERPAARQPAGSTAAPTAQLNSNQLISRLTETKPSANSARSEKLPERGREMILARREELRQGRSERNGSGFISTATAQKNAQLNAYEARQNRVLENNPTVETKPPIYTTLKRCQRQLDGGVAVVGVVVNPEGKIVSELDFLDKQGAAGIEQAAKDYVKDYQFPRTDNTTNQYFHLQFKYDTDNCSERTFKRLLENTNTKQPQ